MLLEGFINEYHYHILIWLGILLITLLLELFSKKTIALWFSVAAIVGILFAALKLAFTIQFVAFIIISVGLLLINEFYFMKKINKKEKKKGESNDEQKHDCENS